MIDKILFWNFRGTGSHATHLYLHDMVRTHCPDVVALLETRVPSSTVQ